MNSVLQSINEKWNAIRFELDIRINHLTNLLHNIDDSTIKGYVTSLVSGITKLLLPIILFVVTLLFSILLSTFACISIRNRLIPQALIKQEIHFDYTKSPPIARMSLYEPYKQWTYIEDEWKCPSQIDCSKKSSLKLGYTYDIKLSLNLARVDDLTKSVLMTRTSVVDVSGELLARSMRPFTISYRSKISRLLDEVLQYPLRKLGLHSVSEMEYVTKTVLPGYYESPMRSLHADSIEVELLGTYHIVQESLITIRPQLRGIS